MRSTLCEFLTFFGDDKRCVGGSMKKPLIILTGPTAVGKTSLSIGLAKAIGGEIISADSMQIYRHMDIGTAKIMPEEMEGVPHYLIDELDPDEEFNVVRFQHMAKQAMEQIYANGHIPILVGGTGFYIQALLYDIDFSETEEENEYRKQLEVYAKEHGAEALHEKLREIDPISADKIHPNNVKRVIRAIEYFEQTGEPISKHNEEQAQKESPYEFLYFVLNHDRSILYERIDQRVDQMIDQGLEQEVKGLLEQGYSPSLVSMQGLGYKEFVPYFKGEYDLEHAIYILKRDTRHFAKRQLTWFKREKDVIWLSKQEYQTEEELLNVILSYAVSKNIISKSDLDAERDRT